MQAITNGMPHGIFLLRYSLASLQSGFPSDLEWNIIEIPVSLLLLQKLFYILYLPENSEHDPVNGERRDNVSHDADKN